MGNENLTKSKKDKTLMIIIGVLSAVLIVLFVFFLVEKKENRENMIAITAEKEELQQELTDLSHHYDNLKTDNDTLNAKLVHEQEKIATLMNKMKKFRNDSYAEINRYKREIGTLKTVLRSYVVQIDSLNQLNQKPVSYTHLAGLTLWLRQGYLKKIRNYPLLSLIHICHVIQIIIIGLQLSLIHIWFKVERSFYSKS